VSSNQRVIAFCVTVIICTFAGVGITCLLFGAIDVPKHPITPADIKTTEAPRPHLAPYVEIPATKARAIDGDTVAVTFTLTVPVRLAGIDAPELRDEKQKRAAQVAKQAVARWLGESTRDGHIIRLRAYRLGVYGRVEGDLLDERGKSLSDCLLRQGMAVSTSGGKRHEWTRGELKAIEELP